MSERKQTCLGLTDHLVNGSFQVVSEDRLASVKRKNSKGPVVVANSKLAMLS